MDTEMDEDKPVASPEASFPRSPAHVQSLPVARGFRQRLAGLGRSPVTPSSLAIKTRSVHTFGLDRSIAVAALDVDGTVLASRVLAPNRIYFNSQAHWIGEWVPPRPPPVGSRWEIR